VPPPEPPPAGFRFEAWPTEFRVVTQKFGANPDDYKPFGLPGHEGVDIRATTGSKVFSVAPGQVKLITFVSADPKKPPYGTHVRVLHADGFETIYAHLQSVEVTEGQTVTAGQLLGLADNTGNSKGSHLHLTLKQHGQSLDGYPGSIIDPTPFLAPLLAGGAPSPTRPAPLVPNAVFVAELDKVKDGTVMAPGNAFTKTWRMKNTGTSTWGDGYRLLRVEGHSLGAPASVPVPACAPGKTVDISVPFIAPPDPQDYTSMWQLVNPQGQRFGQKVWTQIRVHAIGLAPTPADQIGLAPGEAVEAPVTPPVLQGLPALGQPAMTAALGIIYTTYWLRVQAALAAADRQQALLAASNDALAQIKGWMRQEE
jgi:hypothetical protein